MHILFSPFAPARRTLAAGALAALATLGPVAAPAAAWASDHLDSPTVIADPRADIGDLYAWTSPDGRKLNLAMTIVGHSFSDKLRYSFFVDSGPRYGTTPASTEIVCEFPAPSLAECRVEDYDFARGDAGRETGIEGQEHRFKVFTGPRDDPFFNNVRGTRAAYNVAAGFLKTGAVRDAAGCPVFTPAQSQAILGAWRQTDGSPGTNFLARWSTSAIVVQVDLDLVTNGGTMLAVWGTTASATRQIDRIGRPLTGNALLGTITSDAESDRLKEAYNAATPATAGKFASEIAQGLALYDSFAGPCGDQWLADAKAPPAERYQALAKLLADDRLWVNSAATTCTQLFGVELAVLSGRKDLAGDCGGRGPNYDAVNVYRSLLANGTNTSVDDGVHRDDHLHSASVFPFLAAPDAQAVNH
jgi:hypothetical protein